MEHIKNVIGRLFESLWGLAAVQAMPKAGASADDRKYSPQVNLIMQLAAAVKDWEIAAEDLYEKRGYSAQLWSDKKTGRKLIVFFKSRSKKGVMPIFYLPVASGQKPASVLEEALNHLADMTVEKTKAA